LPLPLLLLVWKEHPLKPKAGLSEPPSPCQIRRLKCGVVRRSPFGPARSGFVMTWHF
jgi:hypothetical protein